MFLNSHYETKYQVSYTSLRERDVDAVHCGDITSAPDGASEFIDFSIKACRRYGIRYVMMSVFSFTQQPYCDLPDCFAGVMARQKPDSGEIYDPKTVDNKMDLTADTKICIPMIIDVEQRRAIWTDLALAKYPGTRNNLHTNMSNLQLTAQAMTSLKKPNLYDLFRMHVDARGEFVDNKEEADVVFSVDEGITPFRNLAVL
jgi:hypothetical protein